MDFIHYTSIWKYIKWITCIHDHWTIVYQSYTREYCMTQIHVLRRIFTKSTQNGEYPLTWLLGNSKTFINTWNVLYRILVNNIVFKNSILPCLQFQICINQILAEHTVDAFTFVGTNFRGTNENHTFVGFKTRGHSIFLNNSYRK